MEQSGEELSKVEDSQHDVDIKGSNLFLMPFLLLMMIFS
jgi:TRAP-type mannitol/chloroaromatic compound transport system permease small subunit